MQSNSAVFAYPKHDNSVGFHQHVNNRQGETDSAAKRITLIGALANLILTICKGVVGVVGHSAALIADAVHSAADLISDLAFW